MEGGVGDAVGWSNDYVSLSFSLSLTYILSHCPCTMSVSWSRCLQSTTLKFALGASWCLMAVSTIDGDASIPRTSATLGAKNEVKTPSPQPMSRTRSVGWGLRYCKSFLASVGTNFAEAEYAWEIRYEKG